MTECVTLGAFVDLVTGLREEAPCAARMAQAMLGIDAIAADRWVNQEASLHEQADRLGSGSVAGSHRSASRFRYILVPFSGHGVSARFIIRAAVDPRPFLAVMAPPSTQWYPAGSGLSMSGRCPLNPEPTYHPVKVRLQRGPHCLKYTSKTQA